MNAPREIPPVVIERQTAASNPDTSAWVSANAGSGKTHVLVQRVTRECFDSADFKEGRTAFMEKRKPVWQGK